MAQVTGQVTISAVTTQGEYSGRAFKGWETYSYTYKGEQVTKKRAWTFWFDAAQDLNKGDVIEFSGELTTKAGDSDLTTKTGYTFRPVEHVVNNPLVKVIHKSLPGIETLPPLPANEQSPF